MRVVVTGADGQVGTEIVRALRARAHDVIPWGDDIDVGETKTVLELMREDVPEALVHAAAWTDVDGCERDPQHADRANARGTHNVMDAARDVGAYVVYLSTDYVFDGEQDAPYVETDTPAPLSVYGASKLAGERAMDPDSAIVRTSWVISARRSNMCKTVLALLGAGKPLRFVTDQRGHPTIASDLASELCAFVEERRPGTWHVTNQGAVSWYEFARAVLEAAGADADQVMPITTADLDPPRAARRPRNSVLANARLRAEGKPLLPDFRESLAPLVAELLGN